jgi:hypothetical protein
MDPDGFSTRIHSRVHSTRFASHSPGVPSEPICPAYASPPSVYDRSPKYG